MIASICRHEKLSKHGKDRNGNQRMRCCQCGITIVKHDQPRPLGALRLSMDDAVKVLGMILEDMSIRACSRLTGICKKTICDLILHVGENCDRFLQENVRGVSAKSVEMDELWAFVFCKDKHAKSHNLSDECGDAWTWLAIDAQTKMVLAHTTGKRDDAACQRMLSRFNRATTGRVQVTSDGLGCYTHNVPLALGSRVDFAQLIKTYKTSQSETRYSPASIAGIEIVPRFGNPNEEHISTSYSERLNLSVRMHNRRWTRLTNAHSKSAAHHSAMASLFVAWYNFARPHMTLKQGKVKRTPAMAAGLTDRVWTLEELLTAAA